MVPSLESSIRTSSVIRTVQRLSGSVGVEALPGGGRLDAVVDKYCGVNARDTGSYG